MRLNKRLKTAWRVLFNKSDNSSGMSDFYSFLGIDSNSNEDALSEAKARLSVLTLGSEGCMVYFEGAMGYVPSGPVVPVDSTGAGDAFWGAMLAGIAKCHWNSLDMVVIEDCAEIACKNGAEATQYVGALPPLC